MAEEEQPPQQVGIQTNKGGDIDISQSEVIIAGRDVIHQHQYFHSGKVDWELLLHPVEKLRLESFKLGDSAAARFPFVVTPIKIPYQKAMSALQNARDEMHRKKRGILVVGESNAGKTRLALEVVLKTLPTWLLLRWRPDYTKEDFPSHHYLQDKHIVLFLDDLQEYTEILAKNGPAKEVPFSTTHETSLRSLVEILYQASSHIVVIATCRREHLEQIQATFGWLLLQLTEIRIPTFSTDIRNISTRQAINAFKEQKKKIYLEDWDGTLGSLVLGLSTKRNQYLNFPQHTKAVLKAMLLLATANIAAESELVRLVSAEVFDCQQFLENRHLWQETLHHLITAQLVKEDLQENMLTIRKDVYFEKVVCDYSPLQHAQKLRKDLLLLRDILYRHKDRRWLFRLHRSFLDMGLQQEGIDTLQLYLKIDNSSIEELQGQILVFIDRDTEKIKETNQRLLLQMARAFPHTNDCTEAVTFSLHNNIFTQYNEANQLFSLSMRQVEHGDVEEALLTINQALMFTPNSISCLSHQVFCQILLSQNEEALETCAQILRIDPNTILAWFYRGFILLTQGNQQEGNEAIQQVLNMNPNDLDNMRDKALCLSFLGKGEEALSIIQDVLKSDPQQSLSWSVKGLLLAQLGQHEDAVLSYERALQLDPQVFEYLFQKSFSLNDLNRHVEALQTIEQALQLDTESGNAWYLKGKILLALKRFDEALEALNQALYFENMESDASLWNDKGACLIKMQRYQESLSVFEQALQLDPHLGPAWHNKGAAFLELGQYHESFQAFDEALKWEPDSVPTWLMKGKSAYALEDMRQALAAFDQVLQLDPKNAECWAMKASIFLKSKQYSEALDAAEHTISLNPEDSDVWKIKAKIFLNTKRYEEALQAIEKALKLEPENVELYIAKSYCLSCLEYYEEALSSSTQALQLDPENGVIWRAKGLLLSVVERDKESIEALDHALNFFPEDAQIWVAKGTSLLRLGYYEESLAALNQATRLNPDDHTGWQNQALCLIRLENYEEALQSLDQLLCLDPDDATVQNQRDIIVRVLARTKNKTDTRRIPPYLKIFSRIFKF